ncbi:MAG: hypothetical protein HRU15_08135 [Planctomycetes bacterium]|nr:hypothetical protein [Planctomycetota bacterium]
MSMKNCSLILVVILLVTLSSCSAPRSSSINHHIGANFIAMTDNEYRSASKEIATACKVSYSDKGGDRPLAIHALGDGSLVLSSIANNLQLSNINNNGKRLWTLSTGLDSSKVTLPGEITSASNLGNVCLSLKVDLGPIRNLVYACENKKAQLIRVADANGTNCARFISEQLPDFEYSKAKCEGSKGSQSFAALIRLSQDAAGEERARAAVRSQLEAFSSGTNAWLAEAAASVLIMPLQ